MAGQFRVETDALSSAAGRLSSLADGGTWGGLTQPLHDVPGSVAGADTAAQAVQLAGEVAAVVESLRGALRAMSEAASVNAANYLAADSANAESSRRAAAALDAPAGSW